MDPSRSSLNLLSAIATSTDLNADGFSSTRLAQQQPPPQIQSSSTYSHATGLSSSNGLPPAPRDDYDDPDELPEDQRHHQHHASRASTRRSPSSTTSYLRRRSPSLEQFDYQPRTTYMTTSDTRSDSRASARSGSPNPSAYPPVPPRRSSSRASSHIRDRQPYDESDRMPQSLHPSLKLVTGDSRHSATGTNSPSTFSSTNTNSGQHYHFPGAAGATGHYSSSQQQQPQQNQHDPRRMRSSSSLNRPHPYLTTNFSRPSSSRPSPAQPSRPSPRFSPGYTKRPPSRFSDASSFEGEDGEGEEGSVHSDYYTGPVGMADSSMGGFGGASGLGRQNSIRSDTSTSSSYGNGRRGSESRQGYYDSPTASTSPNFMFVQHSSSSHGGPSGRDGSYPPPSALGAGAGDMNVGPSSSSSSQPTAPPLSLDSLPSYPPDQKPPFSYPVLIRLAIQGSPQKRLLLSQIYAAIEEKFPWYRDSAPKAWKASVRHCLSLNKEFVRMQRAVEDPGVGCGGWWSVGEGMKGLKRPRKRRAPQSKRSDNERMDDSHLNSGSEMPDNYDLDRRRHSVASTSGGLEVPYSAFSTPPMLHSSSLSPASMLPPPVSQSHGLMGRTGPSQPTYADDLSSLRLPPLHLPNQQSSAGLALPTPPSSSRTLTFGTRSPANDFSGEPKFSSYRTHSHTPTPSSSSLSSNQSQASSTSQTSSSNLHYGQPTNGKNRGNPMSISSLLNEGMKLEDKVSYKEDTSMDIDDTVATKAEDSHVTMGDFTPFSSEQTIRRLSPPPALPVSSTKEMRKGSESRPTSSRVVKEEWSSGGRHSSENSRKTPSAPSSSSRRAIDVKRSSERTTRDKGAKAWQANMDLSNMDVESESE